MAKFGKSVHTLVGGGAKMAKSGKSVHTLVDAGCTRGEV